MSSKLRKNRWRNFAHCAELVAQRPISKRGRSFTPDAFEGVTSGRQKLVAARPDS
jgi:hypothetical protein